MDFDGPAVSAYIIALLGRLNEGTYIRTSAFERERRRLKGPLYEIQAVLIDASQKEVTDDSVRLWLNSLQHLCYDLDDVLDDLCYGLDGDVATKLAAMAQEESKSKSMASKVRKLIPKLQRLVKQINELGLKDRKLKDTSRRRNETSLLDFNVVGREREKEKLLNELLRDDPYHEKFSIVFIIGMGGLGKTTLARLLYNERKVKDHFKLMAWVTVSEEFDIFKISKAIFQSLTNVDREFNDLNQLQMALSEKLQDIRFLLVLDDVWTENYDVWEDLLHLFHMVAHGSKIIITARNAGFLEVHGIDYIHHIEFLSREDSLSLLALHALGVDNFDSYPTLRTRGMDIVKTCGGLPLALKTIGSLLREKVYREGWDDALNSETWDSQMADCILPALKLSYNNLPARLKRLFAYCSLFPKDFLIDKENLVLLWLAEGYLNESHTNEVDCFKTLLSMSFFQHAPYHESLLVMHNRMNDLATSVAGDCFLLFDKQIGMVDGAFLKYRHMSFACEKYVGYK